MALNADVLLLTGASGSPANLQMITLLADGNDVIYGDAGNNQIFGQGGNDTIWGGTGNDHIEGNAGHDRIEDNAGDNLIIGDNSRNLASFNTQRPLVQQGFHLIQASPESSLALDPFGNVVLPHLEVVPSLLQGLLPEIGLSRTLSRDNSPVPILGNLQQKDGTRLTALASIVPTLTRHQSLLPGNDTLIGGTGHNTIIGDNYTHITPLRTGNAALDLEMDRLIRDLQQLGVYLQDLALQRDYHYRPAAQTYHIGVDTINGGSGNAFIVGDNQLVQGPFRVENPAAENNLNALIGQLRQALVSSSTAINGLRQSLPVSDPAYQPHTFVIGADSIGGQGGNNTITGDNSYLFMPILNQLTYLRDSFWQYGFGDQLSLRTQPLRNYNLNLGNDTITGGTGNDLMIGDYSVSLTPLVNPAPQTPAETIQLQQSLDLLLSDLQAYIRDRHNDIYGIDFNQENQANSLRAGNDAMAGIDGNDLMIGDNATLVLPFIAGQLTLTLPLQNGNLDLRVSDHNFYHSLPRRFQQAYRKDGVGYTEFSRDTLYGGTGNDILFGLRDSDVLFGQEGNDFLFGGTDSNSLDGGPGTNVIRTGNPGRADETAIAPDIQAKLAAALSPALLATIYETIASQPNQQLQGQLSGRISH
jgi:Ca2+-binding RTX toxin-like protein